MSKRERSAPSPRSPSRTTRDRASCAPGATSLTKVIEVTSGEGADSPILSGHPYCALPETFFDRALAGSPSRRPRVLLAVEREDGRDILRVESV